MGDEDDRPVGAAHGIDAVGDDLEGVDIEPRIGLVQHRQPGLEHGHLEDLVALLLAAREADVHGALDELLVDLEKPHLLARQGEEIHGVELGQPAMLAHLVQGRFEEVHAAHARYLDRILEGQKQAFAGPFLGRHGKKIVPREADAALDHLVPLTAGQHVRQGALARPVGTHDRVHLSRLDREIDAAKDVLALDLHVQVFYLQQGGLFCHVCVSVLVPGLTRHCLRG